MFYVGSRMLYICMCIYVHILNICRTRPCQFESHLRIRASCWCLFQCRRGLIFLWNFFNEYFTFPLNVRGQAETGHLSFVFLNSPILVCDYQAGPVARNLRRDIIKAGSVAADIQRNSSLRILHLLPLFFPWTFEMVSWIKTHIRIKNVGIIPNILSLPIISIGMYLSSFSNFGSSSSMFPIISIWMWTSSIISLEVSI